MVGWVGELGEVWVLMKSPSKNEKNDMAETVEGKMKKDAAVS